MACRNTDAPRGERFPVRQLQAAHDRRGLARVPAPAPRRRRRRGGRPHGSVVRGMSAPMTTITGVQVFDVRFPTSRSQDGSDAMNKDGDYSAAYVVLETDDPTLAGYGFTFTIGRGNDLAVEAARQRAQPLIGRDVAELVADLGAAYRELASDSQLRWLGPEKGVVHLAMAAVMNALWDLAARRVGKPLWQMLVEMTPEQLIDAADLRYLSDVLTREQAIALLAEMEPTRLERIAELETRGGYPCYTTSAGWLGYS